MNQNYGILSGQVCESSVYDNNYSSNSVILLSKDKKQKDNAWRYILLRFRGPINAHEIMIKTAIFDITHEQENLSLCCWLLLRMLYWSLVSRFMTTGALLTLHTKHRKHDYPLISSIRNWS